MTTFENRHELDELSAPQLIESALAQEPDSEEYWDVVWSLRKRADDHTFEAARVLCQNAEARRRILGINILAQLGALSEVPISSFTERTLPVLLPMFDEPRNATPELLANLIYALGHQHDERTVSMIVRYKNHEDSDVRFAVTMSLGSLQSDGATATLMELSRDVNSDVRDWATFGLGSLNETDTPAIRAALVARLDDEDDDTRNEAIRGLAQRGDTRALEPLMRELQSGHSQGLAIEAACELSDPILLPALLQLKAADEAADRTDETLDEAIARCQMKTL